MSPKELRVFREGLGLSRREFAPKLFISEPTLERWERGQGGPGKVHLQILRRMCDHLGAGHSIAYFQYDAGEEAGATEVQQGEKRMIVETLQGLGALVLGEEQSPDGKDWLVTFGLGWAVGEPINLALRCEGSERPERPAIDFALQITAGCDDLAGLSEQVQRICFHHSVFGATVSGQKGRSVITLRHRLFTTGCNPETIMHVLGNFRSCWGRLEGSLRLAPQGRIADTCVAVASPSS